MTETATRRENDIQSILVTIFRLQSELRVKLYSPIQKIKIVEKMRVGTKLFFYFFIIFFFWCRGGKSGMEHTLDIISNLMVWFLKYRTLMERDTVRPSKWPYKRNTAFKIFCGSSLSTLTYEKIITQYIIQMSFWETGFTEISQVSRNSPTRFNSQEFISNPVFFLFI